VKSSFILGSSKYLKCKLMIISRFDNVKAIMSARNIAEQLASAREHALIGDYTSALVYYENVLRHIKKYVEFRSLTLL